MIKILDLVLHKISKEIKKRSWCLYHDLDKVSETEISDPIDVVVTLIEKDILVVEKCLESVKLFSLNKINNIYIISPPSLLINKFCIENNYLHLDEDTISPLTSEELKNFQIKKDRIGWIKQQLIKLNSDQIEGILEKYLIIDADTILLKKQYFTTKNFDVFKFSDEFHFLYKLSSKFILGDLFFSYNSFISHHQIIQKDLLLEMKSYIEKMHNIKWHSVFVNAALNNNNFVSEYELYAQYCIKKTNLKIKKQYWFNLNEKFGNINKPLKISSKALSISYHNYIYAK
jgi:hypothetical protein